MTKRGPDLKCHRCGTVFRQGSRGPSARFCTMDCYKQHRREQDWVERFWKQVDVASGLGPDGDCWEWTGALAAKGNAYGVFRKDNENLATHRLSYQLNAGTIPEGLWVLHRCDNRRCVRPDHLFLGTAQDNSSDMVSKRRQAFGAYRPNAKITDDVVREIRKLYADGVKQTVLASRFEVSQALISGIVRLEKWTHVA